MPDTDSTDIPEIPAYEVDSESGAYLFYAPPNAQGMRLDKWVSTIIPDLSRTRAKALIEAGALYMDAKVLVDPRAKVERERLYHLLPPEPVAPEAKPEAIALDILYEDTDLLIINKPIGMVVHPAPGAWNGTLVNALLHHCGDTLSGIGGVARPGIVHRLDKDTSGVMVVAKTTPAHLGLADLFKSHNLERKYLAICCGAPRPLTGRIETQIGRDSRHRKKMTVVNRPDDPNTRYAITNYQTKNVYGRLDEKSGLPAAALIECRLETGRTHQIRVHMAHINTPVVGDAVYGKHRGIKAFGEGEHFIEAVEKARNFQRQALHAYSIAFEHPTQGEWCEFSIEPPKDMQNLILALEKMPT